MSYYPLSLITFPFSSFVDRGLQIKYKSEYEVLYIQTKFMIIGMGVMVTDLDVGIQSLTLSCCRIISSLILFIIFVRIQPCSFDVVNLLEDKVWVIVFLINIGALLNYWSSFIVAGIVVLVLAVFAIIALIYLHTRLSTRIYPKTE